MTQYCVDIWEHFSAYGLHCRNSEWEAPFHLTAMVAEPGQIKSSVSKTKAIKYPIQLYLQTFNIPCYVHSIDVLSDLP